MLTALSWLYQPQAGRERDCAFVKKNEKQNDYLGKWEIKRSAA
jgi:hypothetical protein